MIIGVEVPLEEGELGAHTPPELLVLEAPWCMRGGIVLV